MGDAQLLSGGFQFAACNQKLAIMCTYVSRRATFLETYSRVPSMIPREDGIEHRPPVLQREDQRDHRHFLG
jgi:hypothetical protein